jgi:hypothetical protein
MANNNSNNASDLQKGSENTTGSKKEIQYSVMVDREKIEFDTECATGRDILTRANKLPVERFQLNVRLKGGKVEKVGYETSFCFTNPGLEKFMTIPLDQTEG